MLQSLTIKNFAIIDQISIDFSSGMTVLSGETGAGKSIIIDALSILCGSRGSSELIRQGSDKLSIEGLFTFAESNLFLEAIFEEIGLDIDLVADDLIIRREITAQGKNIIRINGQLANVTLLKKIGSHLVDIHGQNEHQALLDSTQHLLLLDAFAHEELKNLYQSYGEHYQRYIKLRKEWLNAHKNEEDQKQRIQFLEFQLQELEDAELQKGEEEELEALSERLQNVHVLQQNIEDIDYLLGESDEDALTQLKQVSGMLEDLSELDDYFEPLLTQFENSRLEIEDVAREIASYSPDIDDEIDIDEIEGRLEILQRLQRKYGKSIEELIEYSGEIAEEVFRIKHREKYLEKLEQQLVEAYDQAYQLAEQLHDCRKDRSQQLVQLVEQELKDLYMENSRFSVQFVEPLLDSKLQKLILDAISLTPMGYDQVEFFVATNIGETQKPLVKVASGGELSRFMLALKKVFSSTAIAKVMVFDEIDTGVSGRVAQAIAEKMKQVSLSHQVLAITHLPQVAAIAKHQLYIQKQVEGERTNTQVRTLLPEERSRVIAQMMSGKKISETSLQLAQEMLEDMQQLIVGESL